MYILCAKLLPRIDQIDDGDFMFLRILISKVHLKKSVARNFQKTCQCNYLVTAWTVFWKFRVTDFFCSLLKKIVLYLIKHNTYIVQYLISVFI